MFYTVILILVLLTLLFVLLTLYEHQYHVLSAMLESSAHNNNNCVSKHGTSNNNIHAQTRPMPSPPSMPIIGHIHLLRHDQLNPWNGFDKIRKQFGDVVSLKMGIHPMVLVSSGDTMKEVLLKKGDIFSDRPTFPRHHIIFGGDKENSLALCNWTSTHKDRRKFCKRGIVPNKLSDRNKLLENIVTDLSRKFVNNIQQQQPDQPRIMQIIQSQQQQQQRQQPQNPRYHLATKLDILHFTSDIFMKFLCPESHPHRDSNYEDFVLGCDFVFWDINQSYLIDFLPFLTNLGLGYSYLKKLKQVTDFLRDYIDDEIFDPRHEGLKVNHPNENHSEDYLNSVILEYMSGATSMSLADYKVGFADLLAGHAAVANILTRLLGHLALDEHVQMLICTEAKSTDLENNPALPITEAALQEALRIASSPIVPHVAREDTSLDQFDVPKGTMVLFNIYHLNMSEDYWSEPLKFDPMRFIESVPNKDGSLTHKLLRPKNFMPFSAGMRQCLGYKMVETTSILMVANLCKKFIIRANDNELVKRLLAPRGSIALNPDAECFHFKLFPR